MKDITLEKLSQLATILANELKPGITICLWGDLGAGKTTFSRFIIKRLNPEIKEVPSPTFTLVQEYSTLKGPLLHCDFYRLNSPEEIHELGIDEAFTQAILLIEWPEKMGPYLPKNRLDFHLSIGANLSREIRLERHGDIDVDLDQILQRLDKA